METDKKRNMETVFFGIVIIAFAFVAVSSFLESEFRAVQRITGYAVYIPPPPACYTNAYACIDLNWNGMVDSDDETLFAMILNGTINKTSDPIIYSMSDFDSNGIVDNVFDFQQCFVYLRDKANDISGGVVTCNLPVDNLTGGTESCSDGFMNQDETDVDCGGSLCSECVNGKNCETDSDCINSCHPTSKLCYKEPVLEEPIGLGEPLEEEPTGLGEPLEEEPGYTWVYIMIAIILLFGGGGGAFYFYERAIVHKKMEKEKQMGDMEEESMKNLKEYIKNTLDQGYDSEQIKQALLNEGWDEKILDNLFSKNEKIKKID